MQISETLKQQLHKILIEDEIEAISVVNPQIYEENIRKFQSVLDASRVKYAIHSVLKVNHSNVLLKTAMKNGLRADVSSLGELEQALRAGFTGEMITANGPKNTKFLRKCLEEDVTIVVDSIEEIKKLAKMSEGRDKKVKILVRLSEFFEGQDSRFGIPKIYWDDAVNILKEIKSFDVLGTHFHIGSLDLSGRKSIFWESIQFYKMLIQIGMRPKIIDIGGSFGAYYQSDIDINAPSCTKFSRTKSYYPQNNLSGTDFLERFLTDISYKNGNIVNFLRENQIELWIEPGRALTANNSGFIATTVIGRRLEGFVVNTNSFGVGMREEELPTNPILIDDINPKKPFLYWIHGNLCLESDMIYSRAIPFGRTVQENDIIIFPNMAAYHMDFYETETIAHPKKVRYFQDEHDHLLLDN